MVYDYSNTLNPHKGLIWRIVHIANLPWIFANGLHSGNSPIQSPNWQHIGNPELIQKRANHPVPVGRQGYLNDYVPFYFTPFSPMLLNIKSGRGVMQRPMQDIVILVSSIDAVESHHLDYVFTNSHAYYQWTNFFTDRKDLDKIDWALLQRRDFSRDPNDLAKFERYQAEFLIYQHCPISAIIGICCYNDNVKQSIQQLINTSGITLDVHSRPNWYL